VTELVKAPLRSGALRISLVLFDQVCLNSRGTAPGRVAGPGWVVPWLINVHTGW